MAARLSAVIMVEQYEIMSKQWAVTKVGANILGCEQYTVWARVWRMKQKEAGVKLRIKDSAQAQRL